MSKQNPALVEQYENEPANGLKRFWISWTSWLEDWPEEGPFFFWQTGSLCDGRLRPSMKDDPRAANLPDRSNIFVNVDLLQITDGSAAEVQADVENDQEEDEDDLFDTFYVSGGTICAWIDAGDEEAAWQKVAQEFPDFEKRFCEERPHGTLSGNARGGRFEHPEVNQKKRVVFMLDHGFVVCAFLDKYGPKSGVVHTFEGGGRFRDRSRSDFRKMTIAQPGKYDETIKFLAEEFLIEVEPVNSVAELVAEAEA
jgi:hypothetical protein